MGRPPSGIADVTREIIDYLWERGYAATPINVIVQGDGSQRGKPLCPVRQQGIMLAALDLYARGQSTRGSLAGRGSRNQGADRLLPSGTCHGWFEDPTCAGVLSVVNTNHQHFRRIRLVRNGGSGVIWSRCAAESGRDSSVRQTCGQRTTPEDAAL